MLRWRDDGPAAALAPTSLALLQERDATQREISSLSFRRTNTSEMRQDEIPGRKEKDSKNQQHFSQNQQGAGKPEGPAWTHPFSESLSQKRANLLTSCWVGWAAKSPAQAPVRTHQREGRAQQSGGHSISKSRSSPQHHSAVLQLRSPSILLPGSCQADPGAEPLTSSTRGMGRSSLAFDQLHSVSVYRHGSTTRDHGRGRSCGLTAHLVFPATRHTRRCLLLPPGQLSSCWAAAG